MPHVRFVNIHIWEGCKCHVPLFLTWASSSTGPQSGNYKSSSVSVVGLRRIFFFLLSLEWELNNWRIWGDLSRWFVLRWIQLPELPDLGFFSYTYKAANGRRKCRAGLGLFIFWRTGPHFLMWILILFLVHWACFCQSISHCQAHTGLILIQALPYTTGPHLLSSKILAVGLFVNKQA
jgi:hypothetical protein